MPNDSSQNARVSFTIGANPTPFLMAFTPLVWPWIGVPNPRSLPKPGGSRVMTNAKLLQIYSQEAKRLAWTLAWPLSSILKTIGMLGLDQWSVMCQFRWDLVIYKYGGHSTSICRTKWTWPDQGSHTLIRFAFSRSQTAPFDDKWARLTQ